MGHPQHDSFYLVRKVDAWDGGVWQLKLIMWL